MTTGEDRPTGDKHDCERLRQELGPFVEGELDPAAAARIERELKDCVACQDEQKTLREARALLSGLRTPAPPSFVRDVQKRIRERSAGRFFGRRFMLFGRIPFEWLSLVMIVAMLVYYVISLQSSPGSVSPAG